MGSPVGRKISDNKNLTFQTMKNLMIRVGAVISGAAFAIPAFAIADTDGLIPSVDFVVLSANASSIFAQAIPVGLVVAGLALGLGAIVWVTGLLKTAFRRRSM